MCPQRGRGSQRTGQRSIVHLCYSRYTSVVWLALRATLPVSRGVPSPSALEAGTRQLPKSISLDYGRKPSSGVRPQGMIARVLSPCCFRPKVLNEYMFKTVQVDPFFKGPANTDLELRVCMMCWILILERGYFQVDASILWNIFAGAARRFYALIFLPLNL